jgi:SHS2 domain-containing protein
MQKYNYLPHTADVKFESFGITMRDCFRNAGIAMCNAMYNIQTIEAKKTIKIELKAESAEQLLHKFLEEILYQIDVERMLFREFLISIDEKKFSLVCEMVGEAINPEKHTIKSLVKAVSWHQFELAKQGREWKATVIVDV